MDRMMFPPKGMQEFNFRNEKIAIMENFNMLFVIPVLHRNVMQPTGIPMTVHIICVKKT